MPRRSRSRSLLALLAIIAVGLISRTRFMPELCVAYVGDILWGSLFFVLAALLQPGATTRRLWLTATLATELIEVSQLYQAPWAQAVRATRVGGLLFGHSFSWSDTVCVAVGATLAALLEYLGWRATRRQNPAHSRPT
jgi:hypothetical protein